ncbi:DoxX family protein [Stutzerimonas azotifigens]|uniref:DoxX family protein n=1 Tax=Stutzerimonas azotifigens TaxID=291995 RepID=A0ABR5Z6X1_9GAMM|nr:DoxX family protein [Stutzerimonas azotifigens]MBA1275889.1 DoxX family protein [Stutzerimonas azotifigens]
MNASIQNYSATSGRVLLGLLFLFSGVGKLAAPAATKGYIAAMGVPFVDLAFLGALVVELGFAAALVLGYRVRLVAAMMAAFTLVTALIFHNQLGDQNQMIHFLKNIAIVGGLLQVVAFGAGAFSLDARRAHRTALA